MGAGLRDISDKEIKSKAINLGISGTARTEAIAAVVGKKLEIVDLFLVVSAAVSITFESAADAITGSPILAAQGTYAPGYNPDSHFATAAGEALNISPGGSTDVDGWINYYEV